MQASVGEMCHHHLNVGYTQLCRKQDIWIIVDLMVGQCRRWWSNIKSAFFLVVKANRMSARNTLIVVSIYFISRLNRSYWERK